MPLRMFMKVRFALSLCFVALRVYHSDRSPVEIERGIAAILWIAI